MTGLQGVAEGMHGILSPHLPGSNVSSLALLPKLCEAKSANAMVPTSSMGVLLGHFTNLPAAATVPFRLPHPLPPPPPASTCCQA